MGVQVGWSGVEVSRQIVWQRGVPQQAFQTYEKGGVTMTLQLETFSTCFLILFPLVKPMLSNNLCWKYVWPPETENKARTKSTGTGVGTLAKSILP